MIPREKPISKRCKISHRPEFRTQEPKFYVCPDCGSLIILNLPPLAAAGTGQVSCCGKPAAELVPKPGKDEDFEFKVFGGFENNALRVKIHSDSPVSWIYCKSFQGGQLKYLNRKNANTAIFAFAEDDAYVYCDRDVCRMGNEHCQFQCKRGTVIYAYAEDAGLLRFDLKGF